MAFFEVQFPTDISNGAQGGPVYNTTVIVTASGAEQRVAQWQRGRLRWDVPYSEKTPAQMDALVAFFRAMLGRANGFRFKDWSDYVATAQPLLPISGAAWQLQKVYGAGALAYSRAIKKPVAGTLVITGSGGAVITGWSVDTTTGIVTAAAGALTGAVASFEFDVPCRFDTDQMQMTYVGSTVRQWDRIPIVEILV